jgi:hypothetical protein
VAGDYPPNARPGQCFARVLTPEVYETLTDRIIDTPEKTELKVIPAEWRWEEKTILIKEAYVEYIVVPVTVRHVRPGWSRRPRWSGRGLRRSRDREAGLYPHRSHPGDLRDGHRARPGA